MKALYYFLVLSASLTAEAQTSGKAFDPAANSPHLEKGLEMDPPARVLDFRYDGIISGIEPSPIFNAFIPCTSDGSAYIEMTSVDTGEETLYRIHDSVAHRFSPGKIPGLERVEYRTFFSTESAIAYLVSGIRLLSNTIQSNSPTDKGVGALDRAPKFYVAMFNNEGVFEKLVELPDNLEASHAALFPSGDLLVSGFDQTNKTPRLLLLNQSGQLIKAIQQTTAYAVTSGDFERIKFAAATTLVSHGEDILAWRLNTTDPILDVQSNGTVREVKASLPAGFTIFNLVTSEGNDPWIMQVYPKAQSPEKSRNTSESLYFEISPTDGTILRRLTIQSPSIGHIACKSKGTYRAFTMDDGKHLFAFSAH